MEFPSLNFLSRFVSPFQNNTNKEYLNFLIKTGSGMTQEEFLTKEIDRYLGGDDYNNVLLAYNYYNGYQNILNKTRKMMTKDRSFIDLPYLPNNKIIDNQYAKIVDQKVNYLIGKPITFTSSNKEYGKLFQNYITSGFLSTLNVVANDSVNMGIGYLMPYYNELGQLSWKCFRTWEIVPFWKDEQYTELDAFAHRYKRYGYEGQTLKEKTYVDFYTKESITHYVYNGGKLEINPDTGYSNYLTIDNAPYRWATLPLIPFKRKPSSIKPLILQCKCLQDAINEVESNFKDNMDEDFRSTVLVITNFDGENLEEFKNNLATYGVVKLTSDNDGRSDLKTLKMEINKDNFQAIIDLMRQAMIENCRGYNVRDNRLTSDANQMHIQSMFADVELDADFQSTEYKRALETAKYFIDVDLSLKGFGDYSNDNMKITFNRNMFINDQTTIQNLALSADNISRKTYLANHPYVTDVEAELEEIKKDKAEEDLYNPISSNDGVTP